MIDQGSHKEKDSLNGLLASKDVVRRMIDLDGFTKESVSNILKSRTEQDEQISWKYLRLINFTDEDLVKAYRKLASVLFISGDSQDIDLIHERFCKIYCEQNSNSFSEDECLTIVTAFIMLNKDLHSKKVSKKMSMNQFVLNIQKGFPTYKFDVDFLKSIYKTIKENEIRHTEHIDRVKKRSQENEIDGTSDNKKKKQEINDEKVRNFGYKVIKMKIVRNSTFQLFENKSWRIYFVSIDNLKLSLFKYDDFQSYYQSQFENERSTKISFEDLSLQFVELFKPMEILPLHHAVALPVVGKEQICELKLIDNSKYLFKVKNGMDIERWAYTINHAASQLSKPPMLTLQSECNTRTIIRHNWSTECSKLNFEEQRQQTKNQMNSFQDDLHYLKVNQNKKSSYKSDLKYVENSLLRYKVYYRTLCMVDANIFEYHNSSNKESESQNLNNEWTRSSRFESSSSLIQIDFSSRMPTPSISQISSDDGDKENDRHL